MATIAERQAARRAKAQKKLKDAGKTRATSLSATAERTAQRRGRVLDPLESVIQQAVPAPARPAAPPPRTRAQQVCDVLGSRPIKRGQTLARGVSRTCGSIPIQFNSQANNTTRRFFGTQISQNQAKLRAAGLGDFIPKSPTEKRNAQKQVKKIRAKQKGCQTIRDTTGRRNCLINLGNQIDAIQKEFGI